MTDEIFQSIAEYTERVPLVKSVLIVLLLLLIAGLVEAHISQKLFIS